MMNRFFTLLLAASCLTAFGQEDCVDVSSTFDFSALYLEADYYATDSILYYYVRFYPNGMGEYWQLDPASTLGVLSFEYSLCEQNGNILYTDSFLYEAQVNANGVFEGTTNTGEPFTFTPVREGSPFETETNNCGWQPDGNGDNLIGVNDLLDLLGVYGDTDYDQDGIWDSADDCVGEYDECGVCNGSGPSIPIIESIEILYDSVYAEPIDEWLVFEVGVDTTYALVCDSIFGCTTIGAYNFDPLATINDGSCVAEWTCGLPLEYQSVFYETELIGQQCWFTENLECFQYANGVDILATDDIHDFMDWGNAETPALYFGIVDGEYSIFYNQALAVENAICPVGWHVPSDGDFMVLESHLGMPNDQLPTYGFGGRYVSDLEGLNVFNPVGNCMLINTSLDCYWGPVLLSSSLSSGPYAGEVALYRSFNGALGPNGNGGIGRWYDGLNYAASIRCIKDIE